MAVFQCRVACFKLTVLPLLTFLSLNDDECDS